MIAARAQVGTMSCTLSSLDPPSEPGVCAVTDFCVVLRNLRNHEGKNLPKVP